MSGVENYFDGLFSVEYRQSDLRLQRSRTLWYYVVVVFNYLLVTQCFVNNGLADKTSTEPGLGIM